MDSTDFPVASITFVDEPRDMARYLAFRAQELWPESVAFVDGNEDARHVRDTFFPCTYTLRPERHRVIRSCPPELRVEVGIGEARVWVLNGGLGGTKGVDVQDLFRYLVGLPQWRAVKVVHERLTNVGANTVTNVQVSLIQRGQEATREIPSDHPIIASPTDLGDVGA